VGKFLGGTEENKEKGLVQPACCWDPDRAPNASRKFEYCTNPFIVLIPLYPGEHPPPSYLQSGNEMCEL